MSEHDESGRIRTDQDGSDHTRSHQITRFGMLAKAFLTLPALFCTFEGSNVDLAGHAYATEAWDATFLIDLDGQDGGEQKSVTFRVHPDWAPEGAKRFQDMVQAKDVLTQARFFRVVPKFMVQFGIPPDPTVASKWNNMNIPDDPVTQSNTRGMVTFATSGPNTRTTQLFINFNDNSFLDSQGFSPFAEVIEGMDVVDAIQSKYREEPDQGQIQSQGNTYLKSQFPELSFVSGVSSSYLSSPTA